jgi:DNA-binding NtrC family response regulator
MRIAVVASDYHIVRVFELLLRLEQHSVTCFGKLAQLECSQHQFDLLIVDPGKPAAAEETLTRLAALRPEVRRILVTGAYENIALVRKRQLPVLFWPCSRRLFLALVENRTAPVLQPEEVTANGT